MAAQVPFGDLPVDATAVVADLAFAGRYIPAAEGAEPVAGDFYDVLQLEPDLVALLVGDVSGHGPDAVSRMRQLRAAARAYALEKSGPVSVLHRLDRFVHRLETDGLATLWYGEYQPSTGTLTYASGGHPPPVLHVHGDPARRLKDASSPPLGTGVTLPLGMEYVEVLPPGAILIAYSDGLVERHGTDIDAQIATLLRIVDDACDPARAGDADDIAADILTTLVPDPDQAEDDVCLLVVRRQPEAQRK
jgi:serine phosphatase RsbU (regulator of sigma subunit)